MANEKKTDEKVTVVEITPIKPSKLVRVLCSTCDHPMVARSSEAFHAAREDHLAWKHRPRLTMLDALTDRLPEAPSLELIKDDDESY